MGALRSLGLLEKTQATTLAFITTSQQACTIAVQALAPATSPARSSPELGAYEARSIQRQQRTFGLPVSVKFDSAARVGEPLDV